MMDDEDGETTVFFLQFFSISSLFLRDSNGARNISVHFKTFTQSADTIYSDVQQNQTKNTF